jgi:hypothetical protein
MIDKTEIEILIDNLKEDHYNKSTRFWIHETNWLSKEQTLFKIESQIEILTELLDK